MTIRTFEQGSDRIIIEITNPTNDIKKAINDGLNVETIKFLATKQNIEPQEQQQIVAEIDNEIQPETSGVTIEMPEEIPASAIMEQSSAPEIAAEPTDADIIRQIFASDKNKAFAVLDVCITEINEGKGTILDIRSVLAARKVLLGQTSEKIVSGQINATDDELLQHWNGGLNATVGTFYTEMCQIYKAPKPGVQNLTDGFEPITADMEIPFTAPEPINTDWQ